MAFSRRTQKSFKAAAARVAKAAREIARRFPRGVRLIGEEIMTDVKASRPGHGVPVDTGALRGTGRAEDLGTPTLPRVELSFGGAAAPYAMDQHENMTYHHTVGEPRYLVRGVERWQPGGSAAVQSLKRNAEAGIKSASKGA